MKHYNFDTVLVAKNGDDLQRLFTYCTAKTVPRTTYMTTFKSHMRCKLAKLIKLSVSGSGYEDVESEVRNQTKRISRISAYVNNITWGKKPSQEYTKLQ